MAPHENGHREEPRPRVLIVDDVPAMRRLVRLALEESGHFTVVGEALNGAEAASAGRRLRPDVILLDLAMPGVNGLQALPLLKEACPSARIILHTGFEHERLAREALEYGAHAFLEKGLPAPTLVARLLALLPPSGPSPRGSHVAED
jgi:DNA-binding NarL/FixJ family response regulator